MKTRIKICCISSVQEATLAMRQGADALGLVGRMPSGPGTIDDESIATIARFVPPPLTGVLLTSARTAEQVADHVIRTGVGAVQIVDHVCAAESQRLVHMIPQVRRIQVVHVEDERALSYIPLYEASVHAFLLDSGRPDKTLPELGRSGRAHDWKISAEFVRRSRRPVFLAGGLNAGNVEEAIRVVRPFGVDVCSGVRTDGVLDAGKLSSFIRAVQAADSRLSHA